MVYGYAPFQSALISRNLCIAFAVFTPWAPNIRLFFAYGLKEAELKPGRYKRREKARV
jgi:hypothetical protein